MKVRTIQCWDGDGVIPEEELRRRRESKRDMEAKRARAEAERFRIKRERDMVRAALRQKRAIERASKTAWSWSIHCARFAHTEKAGVHHMTVYAPNKVGPDPEIILKGSGTIDATMMQLLVQAGVLKTLAVHKLWKSVSFQYGFDPHKPMSMPVRWKLIKPHFVKVVQRKTVEVEADIYDIAFTCTRIVNEKVDLPKSMSRYIQWTEQDQRDAEAMAEDRY